MPGLPVVVDGNGDIVGVLVDTTEPIARVLFQLDDERVVVIGVERDRLLGPFVIISFDEFDCEGQVYIVVNATPPRPVMEGIAGAEPTPPRNGTSRSFG